ncbi:MAG: rRNA pseudouridine synthase [Clostridia bacterium]|nr:rRNA pseudouridine synthase [Clostridia bacterium]
MEKIRIDKILSKSGYGSRNDAKGIIKKGRVSVEGKTVRSANDKADPEKVFVDGIKVNYKEFIYLVLNKPKGVVSATDDNVHRTVIDLIDEKYLTYEPFPVGRLDIDTEGLLLITNDGQLGHNMLSPKKHVDKTYYAELLNPLSIEDKEKIEKGVDIGGYVTQPCSIEILENGVNITIHEGKFHQVKKMFEAVGNKVVYLKRITFGPLTLPESLPLGEYTEIEKPQV